MRTATEVRRQIVAWLEQTHPRAAEGQSHLIQANGSFSKSRGLICFLGETKLKQSPLSRQKRRVREGHGCSASTFLLDCVSETLPLPENPKS